MDKKNSYESKNNIRNIKIRLYLTYFSFPFFFLSVYSIFRTKVRDQGEVIGYTVT